MKIVNLRKEKYTVYIGRGSIFGNPYKIDKDRTREGVINLYRYYVRANFTLLKAIYNLPKDAVLGCYCKPKDCHGDVIVELYNKYWKIGLNNNG